MNTSTYFIALPVLVVGCLCIHLQDYSIAALEFGVMFLLCINELCHVIKKEDDTD